jgi:hypothetical protein
MAGSGGFPDTTEAAARGAYANPDYPYPASPYGGHFTPETPGLSRRRGGEDKKVGKSEKSTCIFLRDVVLYSGI